MDWKEFFLGLYKTFKFDNRTNRWLISITTIISVVLSTVLLSVLSNVEHLMGINKTLVFSILLIVFFLIIFTIIDTFWYLCINRFISRVETKNKLKKIKLNKESYYIELIRHSNEKEREALLWCKNIAKEVEGYFEFDVKDIKIVFIPKTFYLEVLREGEYFDWFKEYHMFKAFFDNYNTNKNTFSFSDDLLIEILSREDILDFNKYTYKETIKEYSQMIEELRQINKNN